MVIPADREGRNHDNPSLQRGRPIDESSTTSSRKGGGQKEDKGPQTVEYRRGWEWYVVEPL